MCKRKTMQNYKVVFVILIKSGKRCVNPNPSQPAGHAQPSTNYARPLCPTLLYTQAQRLGKKIRLFFKYYFLCLLTL